jgi:large repetitive protein
VTWMRRLVALACLSLAAAGLCARFSAAAFTSSTAVSANAVTVDALSNYFSVSPGTAVQPGTSTPIASGNVDALALDFGIVPSARTLTNVFRVTNVSGASRTATISLSGVAQVTSVVFASSGAGSATLAPGASTTVTVTTSPTVAGRGAGSVRLGLSGISWLYRDYSLAIDEAPEVAGPPSALQKPAGRIDLSWTASSTTTNLAGYDIYRSSGAAYAKLNATPLTGTTYSDTATADGTTYTYKVLAVSSGTPVLESLDSTTVTATADATAPGRPSAIALANGGGAGGAYINAANASSLGVSVSLPAGSLTSDTVRVTITNGGNSVTATTSGSAGAGTVTVSGIGASGLGDGTVTITAASTDVAGNVSTVQTATFSKDTIAPGAPSAVYTDNNNVADQISGAAEAGAAITATRTAPAPTYSYSTTATGAYSLLVAATNGKPNPAIPVTYTITAVDAAGNTSATTTLNYSDTR